MGTTMQLPDELQFMANARKPQKRTAVRLDGQVCVITGATSGVGLAAARRIAQGGADLVLVCRSQEKADRVKREIQSEYGTKVDLVLADFSDLDQVRRAASEILARYPRLDVLINNAGIHNTHRELTPAGFEKVFCVIHRAAFLFTRLLLERLRESAPARILYVNSEGHRFGGLDLDDLHWDRRRYRGLQGYGAAKTAQLLTIWELADLLQGSGVTVNAMHPGAVATSIGMNNGFLYRWYQKYLLFPFLKNPGISGEAIYYLVASPEMEGISGKFYNQTVLEKPASHALDRDLGRRVWQVSEELTGLSGHG
jgi:NAD(P)-dependent dehydrogenase (short-subunit alcohol dehydrogenase family)